ncbi:MAG TPA: serine hydrolase [Xanthobacteraceae bacterium]|nr:serine hydrolase [Xanthobacteraceae bacterium]
MVATSMPVKPSMLSGAAEYFPAAGDAWQTVAPADAGFDAAKLAAAIAYANAHECAWPRSMYLDSGEYVGTAYVEEKPPHNEVIGEVRPRGGVNGVILRGGRIAAEWGDTHRADMTFSVAKSYLALVAGLAFDRGLIGTLDARVAQSVPDEGFASPHNAAITWRHLLQQSSEWQGTLWDKPDSVDHNRQAGLTHDNRRKGTPRTLQQPGTRFEYNDVRVNRLSLSLMRLWRRPLPDVLREHIMDPIGASDSWSWRGYRNSTVAIDGKMMESVSGGGHWGGGLFISSCDHARVGYLMLRGGAWGGRQLLSARWLGALATPSAPNPSYGLLWWLNTGRKLVPSAPESSLFALGGGQNVIWVDAPHDLVVVVRWLQREHLDGMVARVMGSLAA